MKDCQCDVCKARRAAKKETHTQAKRIAELEAERDALRRWIDLNHAIDIDEYLRNVLAGQEDKA